MLAVAAIHAFLAFLGICGLWVLFPIGKASLALIAPILGIAAYVIAAVGIVLGLWFGKLWARWMVVAVNFLMLIAMLAGPVVDHDYMDPDDIAFTALFAAMVIIALLPTFRRRLTEGEPGVE